LRQHDVGGVDQTMTADCPAAAARASAWHRASPSEHGAGSQRLAWARPSHGAGHRRAPLSISRAQWALQVSRCGAMYPDCAFPASRPAPSARSASRRRCSAAKRRLDRQQRGASRGAGHRQVQVAAQGRVRRPGEPGQQRRLQLQCPVVAAQLRDRLVHECVRRPSPSRRRRRTRGRDGRRPAGGRPAGPAPRRDAPGLGEGALANLGLPGRPAPRCVRRRPGPQARRSCTPPSGTRRARSAARRSRTTVLSPAGAAASVRDGHVVDGSRRAGISARRWAAARRRVCLVDGGAHQRGPSAGALVGEILPRPGCRVRRGGLLRPARDRRGGAIALPPSVAARASVGLRTQLVAADRARTARPGAVDDRGGDPAVSRRLAASLSRRTAAVAIPARRQPGGRPLVNACHDSATAAMVRVGRTYWLGGRQQLGEQRRELGSAPRWR
jgi:hypothetical protein